MQIPDQPVVWGTAAIILTSTVVSGPLLGIVDFTDEPEDNVLYGQGNATVEEISLSSEGVRLDRGEYGSGAYYLEIPPVRMQVGEVRGNPRLVYKLRIPEMGYTIMRTVFLDPTDQGTVTLPPPRDSFAPSTIDREHYRGELTVLLRSGMESRVIARTNVTVEVRG